MRRATALAIAAAACCLAQAQAQSDNGNAIAVPPAPPIVAAPPSAPAAPTAPAAPAPPGLTQTPLPPPASPDNADNGTDNATANAGGGTSAAPPVPTPPPAVQSDWVSGKTAKIRVLDKVDGSIADLTIPVGGQSTSGDLQVSVLACDLHPPGQIPDDAIFVSIQPSGDPAAPPVYRGWMVRSVPAASVAGDASETFRVVSCS